MHTPIANALRDILARIATSKPEVAARPFTPAHSRLVLEMPNRVRDIGEAEAIGRYDTAVRRVCAVLADYPAETVAMVKGLPIFLCPLVGSAVPSHTPVISTKAGHFPSHVDAFEGQGVAEIEGFIASIEEWLKSPDFELTSLEVEIEAGIRDVGDAPFAAAG